MTNRRKTDADSFNRLPREVRIALATMGKDDAAALINLVSFYRTVQGWCRINRWIGMAIITGLIAAAHFTGILRDWLAWSGRP